MLGFDRVVTNPRIFGPPSSAKDAFTFLDALIDQPGCAVLRGWVTADTDFGRFAPELRWRHL